jgi:hypothetical protein
VVLCVRMFAFLLAHVPSWLCVFAPCSPVAFCGLWVTFSAPKRSSTHSPLPVEPLDWTQQLLSHNVTNMSFTIPAASVPSPLLMPPCGSCQDGTSTLSKARTNPVLPSTTQTPAFALYPGSGSRTILYTFPVCIIAILSAKASQRPQPSCTTQESARCQSTKGLTDSLRARSTHACSSSGICLPRLGPGARRMLRFWMTLYRGGAFQTLPARANAVVPCNTHTGASGTSLPQGKEYSTASTHHFCVCCNGDCKRGAEPRLQKETGEQSLRTHVTCQNGGNHQGTCKQRRHAEYTPCLASVDGASTYAEATPAALCLPLWLPADWTCLGLAVAWGPSRRPQVAAPAGPVGESLCRVSSTGCACRVEKLLEAACCCSQRILHLFMVRLHPCQCVGV